MLLLRPHAHEMCSLARGVFAYKVIKVMKDICNSLLIVDVGRDWLVG